MARPSTLRLTERGIPVADEYAEDTLTNLRIQRIDHDAYHGEDGGPAHWALDGVNMNADPVQLSEEIEFFRTHEAAISGMRAFVENNGYTLEPLRDRCPIDGGEANERVDGLFYVCETCRELLETTERVAEATAETRAAYLAGGNTDTRADS